MATTRITRHLRAPRASVYAALLDPEAVARWRVPEGMTSRVHEWNAEEGGTLRVSLTYDAPDRAGKTTAHTDTYRGRFVSLVADERVVEVDRFEADDPALGGPMTITITLADADGGTDLTAVHEGVPDVVPPADNETGWRQSLARLAALVETGPSQGRQPSRTG
ncbi:MULTISPECIES: SRPBCC family protein [unclassified Geodermatophilus]|uniref:SRPBCC family protein n=1 Tax=unclassified Geodermatophilus TaxID=2637632 RepID=UPI003EEB973C